MEKLKWSNRKMKIFNKELKKYFKPTWIGLLVVALIGQLQIFNVLFWQIQIFENLPLGFLKFTQVIWVLIIFINVFYLTKKKDFSFLQALFVGFLYFIAFGVLKIITRIILGHDIHYLFLGGMGKLSPLLECFLIISIVTVAAALSAIYEVKTKKQK